MKVGIRIKKYKLKKGFIYIKDTFEFEIPDDLTPDEASQKITNEILEKLDYEFIAFK